MNEKRITSLIGQSIREGKYLNITYKNNSGDITHFWISILDINDHDELRVNLLNVTKDEPILNAKIFIPKIQTAEILKFSHFDVPTKLVKKIRDDENLQVGKKLIFSFKFPVIESYFSQGEFSGIFPIFHREVNNLVFPYSGVNMFLDLLFFNTFIKCIILDTCHKTCLMIAECFKRFIIVVPFIEYIDCI